MAMFCLEIVVNTLTELGLKTLPIVNKLAEFGLDNLV